jgi:ABC-type dipeptide/oligopeptide/nickel transport system permease subunit
MHPELLLSIPGLYLIIALRAIFSRRPAERAVYNDRGDPRLHRIWALARHRGMVLSIRHAEYVTAAEAWA